MPINPANLAVVDTWMKSKVKSFEHGMRKKGNTKEAVQAPRHGVQPITTWLSSIAAISYGAWVGDKDYSRTGMSSGRLP